MATGANGEGAGGIGGVQDNGQNGNGPSGPEGGGNKESKSSVGRHNVKEYSYKAFGGVGLDFIGKLDGYGKFNNKERRSIAQARSPFSSFVHRLGSWIIPGVDSYLSVDEEGELVSEDYVDPTGFGLGLATTGMGLAGSLLVNEAYDQAATSGLINPSTYYSSRKISDFENGVQVSGLKSGTKSTSATSTGGFPNSERQESDRPLAKSKSLFDSAQESLYPDEEQNKAALGVGVSTGASAVRKAPTLSGLNVFKPIYGKG